jgi:hypothetical protein
MTSSVKVSAHCGDNKKVQINVVEHDGVENTIYLENGETTEISVYDEKSVSVKEVVKE